MGLTDPMTWMHALMVTYTVIIIAITGDQQSDACIPSIVYIISNNNGTGAPTRGPMNVSTATSAPVDTLNAGGSVQCLFWFSLLYALLLVIVTLDIV